MATKECPSCKRLVPISCQDCKHCGHHWLTEREEYDIMLSEYVSGSRGSELQQWVAEKMQAGWKMNRILIQACLADPDNKKKVFDECVEILQRKHGSKLTKRYWAYFYPNYLKKAKRPKRE